MKMMNKKTVESILSNKSCYGFSCGHLSQKWCPAYAEIDDCDVEYPDGVLTEKAKLKLEKFLNE